MTRPRQPGRFACVVETLLRAADIAGGDRAPHVERGEIVVAQPGLGLRVGGGTRPHGGGGIGTLLVENGADIGDGARRRDEALALEFRGDLLRLVERHRARLAGGEAEGQAEEEDG